ncbi:hypothetical protein KFE25_000224 [Diacronema lutheri]|uniref:RRM domain-containing protein n=3 Tax=Diacronema lutheri TaxID=2081491 RepID=A0A8J5XFB5_DIALT|nr:hypothetical protein KFE25_000224 [Diacronema lutheri]
MSATQAAVPDGMKLGEDFPYVCETCLGPNPYLRMMKMPMSRECKISGRPYTAFRWKPGAEARYKETIIAPEVGIAKGVCQVCLMDMRFNVPVAVRDKLLGAGADASARPQSDANKEFYWAQERKAMLDGRLEAGGLGGAGAAGGLLTSAADYERLQGLARPTPHYDRNLPKLCTFWLKGKCTRVLNRECPYRPCNGTFRFPELNSQHKELSKDLTARLDADGAVAVMKSLDPVVDDIKEKLLESQRGNRTENIRNRYHGVKDALSEKMMGKLDAHGSSMQPPDDRTITTLWVGALPLGTTREELHDVFYAHGEIHDITLLPAKQCAFVEYRTRAAAEVAAEALPGTLSVRGQRVRLQWGKARQERGPGGPRTDAPPVEPQPYESTAGPFGEPAFYPSMDPSAMGANPNKEEGGRTAGGPMRTHGRR